MKFIPRPTRNEVFPSEPPGLYPHALGRDCWCKPSLLGTVIVHRPAAEVWGQVTDDLLRSNLFPYPWDANRV